MRLVFESLTTNRLRKYKKMLKEVIFVLIIIAIAVVLLAIRLIMGRKNVVHTHIEGNREMDKRGIHCVMHQDMEDRLNSGLKIKERQ